MELAAPPAVSASSTTAEIVAAAPSAISRQPPTVIVDGRRCVARLHGIVDASGLWAQGRQEPSECLLVSNPVHKLPYTIGRATPERATSDDFLAVDSSKMSRLHARIDFDPHTRRFHITCLSKLGIDVNGSHVANGQQVLLPEKSTLRVGPLYCYFLLPLATVAEAQMAAMGGAAAAAAVVAADARPRPRGRLERTYQSMVDAVYEKHFKGEPYGGFFNITEATIKVREEYVAAKPCSEDIAWGD